MVVICRYLFNQLWTPSLPGESDLATPNPGEWARLGAALCARCAAGRSIGICRRHGWGYPGCERSGNGSAGEIIVLSMGFYGGYIFQRHESQWTQLSPPEITFQAMGMHTMSYILTAKQDLLIFGSTGLSEAGAGVLLVDLEVLK
jgi:hypothetical protein